MMIGVPLLDWLREADSVRAGREKNITRGGGGIHP